MGLDQLQWTGVVTFLTEWFASPLIDGAIKAIIAVAVGRFALKAIVNALT